MRKLETTACKAGCRWTSECGCTGMSLLDFKQPASERGTFKETLLAVIMKLCLDVHCDGLPISSKWAETNECLEGRKSIQQLNVQKVVGKDGKCTRFAVSTKSGTFCAAVALVAERDLPAVQSLRRGAWQEDTAGGDGDRLDSFCSSSVLWSMSYHLSLPVCMPLSSAANPDSVLPHASCCPLFTVFCCVLSQAVPHPLPLSVSISLLAIYHPGPFKSIP